MDKINFETKTEIRNLVNKTLTYFTKSMDNIKSKKKKKDFDIKTLKKNKDIKLTFKILLHKIGQKACRNLE